MKQPPYGWIPGREKYMPLRTLFDCALYKVNLRVSCKACAHSRVVDAPGLWWLAERKRWDQDIAAFSRRFYCGECWRTRHVVVRNVRVVQSQEEAEGPLLPGPDKREWKARLSRYRA